MSNGDDEDEDEDEGEFQNRVYISTRYKERRHDWRALGGEHVLHNLDTSTLPLKQSTISRYNREPGNAPRVREESDLLYIASVQPKSTPHRLPPKSSTLGLERLAAVSHCYAVKMGSHFQLPPMRNTRPVSAAMLALAPKHLPCAPVPTRPTSQAAASASSVRFNS